MRHLTTIKQEIRKLKIGEEKTFKVDFVSGFITIRKSKLKGLEIIINDDASSDGIEIEFEELKNNFRNFSLYKERKIDY